ncbi:hypothetical protein PR048_017930 [Dryococelus australis]|uniref:Uncharacterized protein n=1 Tax=Dryococelus australis TaxID=614101 RepID=A0ABQ9HB02_9NEOP|nr:hypothetical protein PR048_017930 [Dryococelus australis]
MYEKKKTLQVDATQLKHSTLVQRLARRSEGASGARVNIVLIGLALPFFKRAENIQITTLNKVEVETRRCMCIKELNSALEWEANEKLTGKTRHILSKLLQVGIESDTFPNCARHPMRVIEVWNSLNERAGETGDPRVNSPTSGIIRHDAFIGKYGNIRNCDADVCDGKTGISTKPENSMKESSQIKKDSKLNAENCIQATFRELQSVLPRLQRHRGSENTSATDEETGKTWVYIVLNHFSAAANVIRAVSLLAVQLRVAMIGWSFEFKRSSSSLRCNVDPQTAQQCIQTELRATEICKQKRFGISTVDEDVFSGMVTLCSIEGIPGKRTKAENKCVRREGTNQSVVDEPALGLCHDADPAAGGEKENTPRRTGTGCQPGDVGGLKTSAHRHCSELYNISTSRGRRPRAMDGTFPRAVATSEIQASCPKGKYRPARSLMTQSGPNRARTGEAKLPSSAATAKSISLPPPNIEKVIKEGGKGRGMSKVRITGGLVHTNPECKRDGSGSELWHSITRQAPGKLLRNKDGREWSAVHERGFALLVRVVGVITAPQFANYVRSHAANTAPPSNPSSRPLQSFGDTEFRTRPETLFQITAEIQPAGVQERTSYDRLITAARRVTRGGEPSRIVAFLRYNSDLQTLIHSHDWDGARQCDADQGHPMRVIKVNMERRQEWKGGGGDPRENPPTNGIVRHDSHLRKSGDPAWDCARFALVGGEGSPERPPLEGGIPRDTAGDVHTKLITSLSATALLNTDQPHSATVSSEVKNPAPLWSGNKLFRRVSDYWALFSHLDLTILSRYRAHGKSKRNVAAGFDCLVTDTLLAIITGRTHLKKLKECVEQGRTIATRQAREHVSAFGHGRIVTYRDCILSYREIGSHVGINATTVKRIWDQRVCGTSISVLVHDKSSSAASQHYIQAPITAAATDCLPRFFSKLPYWLRPLRLKEREFHAKETGIVAERGSHESSKEVAAGLWASMLKVHAPLNWNCHPYSCAGSLTTRTATPTAVTSGRILRLPAEGARNPGSTVMEHTPSSLFDPTSTMGLSRVVNPLAQTQVRSGERRGELLLEAIPSFFKIILLWGLTVANQLWKVVRCCSIPFHTHLLLTALQNPAVEWFNTLRMFQHIGIPPKSSAMIVGPSPADARSHHQLSHPGSRRTQPSAKGARSPSTLTTVETTKYLERMRFCGSDRERERERMSSQRRAAVTHTHKISGKHTYTIEITTKRAAAATGKSEATIWKIRKEISVGKLTGEKPMHAWEETEEERPKNCVR